MSDFEELVHRWAPKIYGLSLRLSCRPQEAEDIAQETFLKGLDHWDSFRSEADTGTWLYRICVNVWKNRVRAERRRRFWENLAALARRDGISTPPPERQLETQDRQALLQQALAALEDDDRAIIVMREMDERSYEEIAEWLDLPMGTVKSRLARARQKLKILYGDSHA